MHTKITSARAIYTQIMIILTILAGFPCMAPVARAVMRNALAGCPRRDDAEQVVSEFVTTAVRHSHSRGTQFELSLDVTHGWLRIEVKDGGPFGYPPPKPLDSPASHIYPWIALYEEDRQRDRAAEVEEYGQGLAIISAFSDRWGQSSYPGHSIWWAELAWPDSATSAVVNGSNHPITTSSP
jgi:hypothetical protein